MMTSVEWNRILLKKQLSFIDMYQCSSAVELTFNNADYYKVNISMHYLCLHACFSIIVVLVHHSCFLLGN